MSAVFNRRDFGLRLGMAGLHRAFSEVVQAVSGNRMEMIADAVLKHNDKAGELFFFWLKSDQALLGNEKISPDQHDLLLLRANCYPTNKAGVVAAVKELRQHDIRPGEIEQAVDYLVKEGRVTAARAKDITSLAVNNVTQPESAVMAEIDQLAGFERELTLAARARCDALGLVHRKTPASMTKPSVNTSSEATEVKENKHCIISPLEGELKGKFGDCPHRVGVWTRRIASHTVNNDICLF